MGTLQSCDPGHCECTGIPQAKEIAGTLTGEILNVLVMCWAGTCMVLCPFPCNVLVMYWPGTLALAPSDY